MRTNQECKLFFEGKLFKTTNCGDLVIEKYLDTKNVVIRFINTGTIMTVRSNDTIRGFVKDAFAPKIYNVGMLGDKYPTISGGKIFKEYMLWVSMLQRCYDSVFQARQPSYIGCYCSENFKYYQHFKDWCCAQTGFNHEGFQLDKDILVKGNKIYSEETCCFVPAEINMLFTKRQTSKGAFPLGVRYKKDMRKYEALMSIKGMKKYLGSYNTPEEAFYAYKKAKEDYIKVVANKWKDQIDPRVYDALMNYQVEIVDGE